MDVLTSKLVSSFILGICSILFGVLPLVVQRFCLKQRQSESRRGKTYTLVISAITCFGGGVILTTALTHMLPEVNLLLKSNIKHKQFPDTGLPMAEVLMLSGFFMIYVVEEVTHAVIDKCHSGSKNPIDCHGHSHTERTQTEVDEMQPMVKQNGSKQEVESPAQTTGRDTEEDTFEATLKGFLVVLALSLHETFEGVALGLFRDQRSVWFLFLAISFHKFVISFCLGMQFIGSGLKTRITVLYICTFSLMTVVGACVGIILFETVQSDSALHSPLVTVLQGLATGTLLYVAFFEVLENERKNDVNKIFQMGFVLLGFLAMVLFELIMIQEVPEDIQDELSGNLDQVFEHCTLKSLPEGLTLPHNFTCDANNALIPVS